MNLPKGLFWLKADGGITESYIYSLLKMGDDLYRDILVITDINITYDSSTGKVKLNGEMEDDYDYCFMTGSAIEMDSVIGEAGNRVNDRGWRCWMVGRNRENLTWESAEGEKNRILSMHPSLNAVCIPDVTVNVGPRRDIIFTRVGTISSVMSPNSGDGFWREIFRATGFYGAKAKTAKRDLG